MYQTSHFWLFRGCHYGCIYYNPVIFSVTYILFRTFLHINKCIRLSKRQPPSGNCVADVLHLLPRICLTTFSFTKIYTLSAFISYLIACSLRYFRLSIVSILWKEKRIGRYTDALLILCNKAHCLHRGDLWSFSSAVYLSSPCFSSVLFEKASFNR